MATKGIPLGALQSFGMLDFTTLSADPDNEPPQILVGGDPAFLTPGAQAFGQARTGLGAAAFKGPVVSWKYWLAATAGLGDAAAYGDLQARLDLLYTAYWGTYTYGGYSGVSGQVGDLVVKEAKASAPANRTAFAYWLSYTNQLQPGDVAVYQVTLQFQLGEHFH